MTRAAPVSMTKPQDKAVATANVPADQVDDWKADGWSLVEPPVAEGKTKAKT
jgi:hypothetical protein